MKNLTRSISSSIRQLSFCLFLSITCAISLQSCKKNKEAETLSIQTLEAKPVSPTKVILRGSLTSKRDPAVSDHGFVYSFSEPMMDANSKVISLGSKEKAGEFSTTLEGIDLGTTPELPEFMFVKAYYDAGTGKVFGEQIKVTMLKTSLMGMSPMQGQAGDEVIIKGNFNNAAATDIAVYFENVKANVLLVTKNQISVAIPSGVPLHHGEKASVEIHIYGQIKTATTDFIMTATFRDFNPKSGPMGTSIHFTGDNLPGTDAISDFVHVKIGHTMISGFPDIGYVNVFAPLSDQLESDVSITVEGRTTNFGSKFVYTPFEITSITPMAAYPGERLVLRGNNLPKKFIENDPAPVFYRPVLYIIDEAKAQMGVKDGYLFTSTPFSDPGVYSLELMVLPLTTPLDFKLTILPFPTVEFSPKTGKPGTEITIVGKFFKGTAYQVSFNGRWVSGKVNTEGELTVAAPDGDPGEVFILKLEVTPKSISFPGTFTLL